MLVKCKPLGHREFGRANAYLALASSIAKLGSDEGVVFLAGLNQKISFRTELAA